MANWEVLFYSECRFWPNNNSRMYVLENTGTWSFNGFSIVCAAENCNESSHWSSHFSGDFVSTHGLQLGDFIMVYQDDENQNYVSRPASVQILTHRAISSSHLSLLARVNIFVFPDQVIQARKATEEEDVYMDIVKSNIDDIFLQGNYDLENNASSFSYEYCPILDDDGMSFIYDTTFSSDSPLDFLGGSMTSFTRTGPPESFGSVENLSLDDFYWCVPWRNLADGGRSCILPKKKKLRRAFFFSFPFCVFGLIWSSLMALTITKFVPFLVSLPLL